MNEPCECKNWATLGIVPLLSHHPRCSKYRPVADLMEIVKGLLAGIESWAADEDGIHDDCFEAYKKAKIALGQFDFVERGKDL